MLRRHAFGHRSDNKLLPLPPVARPQAEDFKISFRRPGGENHISPLDDYFSKDFFPLRGAVLTEGFPPDNAPFCWLPKAPHTRRKRKN